MPRNVTSTAIAVALLCSLGLAGQASATEVTMCPTGATIGGFGGSPSTTTGPLDATCGANSAVVLSLPASTDYAKLQFHVGTPGYPASLALKGLLGLSANVVFSGNNQPYYLLAFIDPSNSLGQAASGDQILMLNFQPTTLVGSILPMDPATTQFNLYDNTTGQYLQGGQQDTKSLAGWLAEFPSIDQDTLQGVWIGEGLTATDSGPESLQVDSLTMRYVPEPASLSLIAVALAGVGLSRRKRHR